MSSHAVSIASWENAAVDTKQSSWSAIFAVMRLIDKSQSQRCYAHTRQPSVRFVAKQFR